MTNVEISLLLRNVAASLQITGGNRFQIIAYERAADAIENLTSDVFDLQKNGKLEEIPGVGPGLAQSLEELIATGHVKHFEELLSKVPGGVFPLLLVPGIGPKKAFKLVTHLKLHDEQKVIGELEAAAKAGKIAVMEGFGEKSEQDIIEGIETYKKGQIKEKRMGLPLADAVALDVIDHIKKQKGIVKIDVLGSLRRRVATIGDIDIAVATHKPEAVIKHFITYPHQKLIEEGPTGASLLLHNGRQVDLRVQRPEAYGAMLQYFTGSKHHNIKLRNLALGMGLSLNEYGIKVVGKKVHSSQFIVKNYNKELKVYEFRDEESLYGALGLSVVPPELREDRGEVEASIKNSLPKLITQEDIKGDLHIHTSYDLQSSHDLGADPLPVYLAKASELAYEYIGLSDHNPRVMNNPEKNIVDIMMRRKEKYEQLHSSYNKSIQKKSKGLQKKPVEIFIMCEVDILPDGTLALPKSAFEYVDAVVVSIHSSFTQNRADMTKRVIRALTAHSKVRIFGHPTGRLLAKREGIDVDWNEIFSVCKERDIALEINAYPERLDLPDSIVFDARREGLQFCIDTDSHMAASLDFMHYGISVARRGWATRDDIVNTMEYNKFKKWLLKT